MTEPPPSLLALMRRVHRGEITPEEAVEIVRRAEGSTADPREESSPSGPT